MQQLFHCNIVLTTIENHQDVMILSVFAKTRTKNSNIKMMYQTQINS